MLIFAHDYETTGVDPNTLGVCQAALCFVELNQDGTYTILEKDVQVLDPGHPIPAPASAVHGLYDHDVVGKPYWESYLAEQFEVVNGSGVQAVVGYNSRTFDDRIARRAGLACLPSLDLIPATRQLKKAGKLKSAKLGDAYKTLVGREPENAHDAFADVVMTLDLIAPCIDLLECESVDDLIAALSSPALTPKSPMPFGKHKGVKICNLPASYVRWALENMNLDPDMRAAMEACR